MVTLAKLQDKMGQMLLLPEPHKTQVVSKYVQQLVIPDGVRSYSIHHHPTGTMTIFIYR